MRRLAAAISSGGKQTPRAAASRRTPETQPLGGENPTLDGYAKIKVPAQTQTGKVFRLRDKTWMDEAPAAMYRNILFLLCFLFPARSTFTNIQEHCCEW